VKVLALIDADVLRYEIGSMAEGTDGPLSFDYVETTLNERIEQITAAAGATHPVLYLTGANNFRHKIAKTKVYKGNRKSEKPYHFNNITAYMKNAYQHSVSDGVEADDCMAMEQTKAVREGEPERTVICTRDKDLLMVPGYHYGWECGQQRERHRHLVTEEGRMYWDNNKLRAEGLTLFWVQMLTGDTVDNIPGCPGIGPKKAFDILENLMPDEMYEAVRSTYHSKGLDDEVLLEQGQLLWMVRDLDWSGEYNIWKLPSS